MLNNAHFRCDVRCIFIIMEECTFCSFPVLVTLCHINVVSVYVNIHVLYGGVGV